MKRLWLIGGSIVALGLIVAGVLVLAPKPTIPDHVKKQFTSTIVLPASNDTEIDINKDSVKYDENLKLLTFTTQAYDANMVVSEQPTPESFVDIPQVYDKVVAGMGEYTKFDTDIGTIHLTRPKELKGKQAAVLNTKGTLLFAKPDKDLSDDQWRKFFGSFEVAK